jgi:predicted peptidase
MSARWATVATNQPERFAAVLPCCPAGFRSLARSSAAAHVPFWAFEGAINGGPSTRNVIDALKQSGGHPKFTVYPDAGHNIWDRAFAEPEIVKWLFAQSREKAYAIGFKIAHRPRHVPRSSARPAAWHA